MRRGRPTTEVAWPHDCAIVPAESSSARAPNILRKRPRSRKPNEMMKSSLAAYNLIGMEFSADTDTRRQVYVNFRQIFEQEKRKGVGLEKGRIKTLVKTRESMQPLRARMGQQKLLSLLRSMVDEGIFDSELRAWQEFPELFPARPPGDSVVDLQHVAVAEGCKERGEDGSVDDLTDDELGETMPASTKDAAIQHGTISALLPDSTSGGEVKNEISEFHRLSEFQISRIWAVKTPRWKVKRGPTYFGGLALTGAGIGVQKSWFRLPKIEN